MTVPIQAALQEALGGRYTILEECGRGGMSVVYRARDMHNDKIVAIKVMRPELVSQAAAERFLREIHIVRSIDHPNAVRLLDAGEVGNYLYCVLDFIDGETLRARLLRQGPFPVEEALSITRDVSGALTYAHARGFIHRDVKPENILISRGRAYLSDFGIARAIVVAAGERVTESGVAVGTASYMSPEQATGSAMLDERTDEYALAVCLYEMLAGDPPFPGRTATTVLARQMSDEPPRLEIARPLVEPGIIAAIEKALAKVPADRYASVADFVAALGTADTRLRRPKRRSSAWIGVSAFLAVVVISLGTWLYTNRLPTLDDARVLVFPARTGAAGSDPEEGLRIADAIQVAVEHTDPLRWIPAWDDLDSATRANPGLLQRTRARELALRRGARYFVTSSATTSAGQATVTLLLYDAAGDTLVAQESATSTPVDSGKVPPSALAIRALPVLLAHMLDPRAKVDLSPLTDRNITAIVRLLEGDGAYRRAQFAAAFDFYRQAVAEDSLFAYAAIKGAQAASWRDRQDEAADLIRLARSNEGLLPPKYRPFLAGVEAYLDGRADDAVAGFRQALNIDPYWAEPAMALGDTYYHLIPSQGSLDSLARTFFMVALESDSTFTPPLFHLAEIAVLDGDARRARSYLNRLTRVGADSSWTMHLSVMLRCLEGGISAAEWKVISTVSPDDALEFAQALSPGALQARCAMDGFRAVLATGAGSTGTPWGAALGVHGLLVAQGRSAEAVQFLDSVRVAMQISRPFSIAALTVHADSAFADMAREGAKFATNTTGPHYERAPVRPSWVFGQYEAWRGNRATVEALSARLATLSAESPTPVARLAAASLGARLTLMRGDTAGAIRQLLSLPVVAPRDSLSWEYFEPLAPDRLTLSHLLLATGRPAEAFRQAAVFDQRQPIAFLAYLRPSLEIRIRAATQLGQSGLASRLRERLRALDGRRITGR